MIFVFVVVVDVVVAAATVSILVPLTQNRHMSIRGV